MDKESAGHRGIRWWPLPVLAVLATAGITASRVALEADRQAANTVSVGIGLLAIIGSGVWLFLFSGVRRNLRIWIGGGVACALILFAGSFRTRGFTGDMMPIFEWRWGGAVAMGSPTPAATDLPLVDDPVPGLVDFPQFLGPDRNSILPGPDLARDWDTEPPHELWRRSLGAAWSGFAVAGRRAVTQEQHGDDEVVACYDVLSGNLLWVHRDPTRFESIMAGVGPRATPTIDGERVFTQGATGRLNCLDLGTGEILWSLNTLEHNRAPMPEWGLAGSPLVAGDRVIVSVGGTNGRSLVAYDKTTGTFLWGGGSEPAHWSSPVLASLAGAEQVLIFNGDLVAHDANSGDVLWTHPWNNSHPHISNPLVLASDRVLVSSGYGTGSELLQINKDIEGRFAVERIWRSTRLKAKFTNLVIIDGFVYGLDDGIMTCVDLSDGSRRWKGGRYGHGQILLVNDLLLVTTETGDVVLLEPVPDELREITRFTAFDAKTWNPPALAGEYLLLRNDQEAVCYRLPIRGS